MLCIAGDGWLHKAVSVGSSVHIIEELQIFSPGQPVQNLLLDPDRVSRPRRSPGHMLGVPGPDPSRMERSSPMHKLSGYRSPGA